MKMYILILDDVPSGFAVNSAAHASLACYLDFKDHPNMQEWLLSFKKVSCKVSMEELRSVMLNCDDYTVITEGALDNRWVAVAFCPRPEWPQVFKTFKLYQ